MKSNKITPFADKAGKARTQAVTPFTRSRTRAFSVVELLVVLAIISIVAALLFPMFARARQKSGNDLCVSNLHQVYLATQLYVQDYDHVYPFAITEAIRRNYMRDPATTPIAGTQYDKYIPTLPSIQAVLDPYDGKTRSIFHCPYDTQQKTGWLQYTNFAAYGLSYEYNPSMGLEGLTDATVPNFAQKSLMNDVLAGWHTPEIEPADDMGKRRGNVQFLDGHCKAHFFQDAYTLYFP